MSTAALLLAMLLSSGARAEGICGSGSSYPIAGTSGFQNALQALRVNAQTYSASRFAERNLLEALSEGEEGLVRGKVAWESTVLYGATSLPSYQSEAVHRSSADCPPGYAVALRSVDLQSNSLGFSVQRARLGFFYSASVVFGQVAESDMTQDSANDHETGVKAGDIYGARIAPRAPLGRGERGASAMRGRASLPRKRARPWPPFRPPGRNGGHGRRLLELCPRHALVRGLAHLLHRAAPHRAPDR